MVPKRVSERLIKVGNKFQHILKNAKDRDVNETDTVSIIKDMLAEVFGYDRYVDITSEVAIRGTYCDLAIKVDNKIEYLVEVKAIGSDLKDSHLRQAIEYGAHSGYPWVILTNGMTWQIHKIRVEKTLDSDLVCSFDFAEMDLKNEECQEMLFIVCKEGLVKDTREAFHEKILIVNRFIIGAIIIQSDEVINIIRRELRKISDGVMASPEEIAHVLQSEVIKKRCSCRGGSRKSPSRGSSLLLQGRAPSLKRKRGLARTPAGTK